MAGFAAIAANGTGAFFRVQPWDKTGQKEPAAHLARILLIQQRRRLWLAQKSFLNQSWQS
jgi:hypothetical protein